MSTQAIIPTVGECASKALRDFVLLERAQRALSEAEAMRGHPHGGGRGTQATDPPAQGRRTPVAAHQAAPTKAGRTGGLAYAYEQSVRRVAVGTFDLIQDCDMLVAKFPHEFRSQLLTALPFTPLELELFKAVPASIDDVRLSPVTARLVARVQDWITRSPILVEEARVDVAEFLRRLRPHLDSWAQRQETDELIARLCNSEGPEL